MCVPFGVAMSVQITMSKGSRTSQVFVLVLLFRFVGSLLFLIFQSCKLKRESQRKNVFEMMEIQPCNGYDIENGTLED